MTHKNFTPGTHLDLGCGSRPRNPYFKSKLIGCDIVELDITNPNCEKFHFIQTNLFSERLPFNNDEFDSVSAFDFIEHVPRISLNPNNPTSLFIHLMSEIYRILKPNGIFLASTPAFPRKEAFTDPTHVNFITSETHEYFCGDSPYASRYGFVGKFENINCRWEPQKNLYDFDSGPIKKWFRKNIQYKIIKGGIIHYTWELKAIKN